jgi:hypothetical protein
MGPKNDQGLKKGRLPYSSRYRASAVAARNHLLFVHAAAYSSLNSPSHFSHPRYGSRVGLHIVLFGACSAAPSRCERLTNRRTGRSPSASERPEHVAQVRTRRTAAPDQPAADPSSIRSPAPTGQNESAITLGINIEFFNTIRQKRTYASQLHGHRGTLLIVGNTTALARLNGWRSTIFDSVDFRRESHRQGATNAFW